MSQTPPQDVERFQRVAHELVEVFSERGYRIDSAMDVDKAFISGTSRSSLSRDLALDAISAAASRNGLDFRPVNGLGREFRCASGGADRRYRLRKAHALASGGYKIEANTDSALAVDEDDVLTMPTEHWVFAYTTTKDHEIETVFLAPVLGKTEGHPGHYILGHTTELLTAPVDMGAFQPADEDDLFGDDEQSGEFGS